MQFKLDENLPHEAAVRLKDAGPDAVTIVDQQLSGAIDRVVASVCQAEQRSLLTLDLDFADLRSYPPGQHPGIVVLRPHSHSRRSVLSLIEKLIPLLATEPLVGKLWILQENSLRIREN